MSLNCVQLCEQVSCLAPELDIRVVRDGGGYLDRFATLSDATDGEIAFLANPKYLKQLLSSHSQAVVLNGETWLNHIDQISHSSVIVCDKPYVFFAFAAQVLERHRSSVTLSTIHPSASIAASVTIGRNVNIAPFVVIDEGAIVGDNCVINAHCTIGKNAHIGDGVLLYANVTIYDSVQIGQGCIVHSGTVIGSDGFGFAPFKNQWVKIPQTGSVVIGNDVEIGANCAIDRGALGDTTIGRGTKLDNLIQIAHNVQIGEDCAFAANIAIAGSAVVGNRVQMGGKAGILGHLSVCDDVVISSCTLVTKNISKAGFYSGVYPIQENADWEKNAVALKRLNSLRLQVRALEQAMGSLTTAV